MRDNITTHLLIVILTEVKFSPTSLCYTDRLCIPEFLCMLPVPPYFTFQLRIEILDFNICGLMINANFQFRINIAVWRKTEEEI